MKQGQLVVIIVAFVVIAYFTCGFGGPKPWLYNMQLCPKGCWLVNTSNITGGLAAPVHSGYGGGGGSGGLPAPGPTGCPQVSVDLGSSAPFTILSESGITDIPASHITGNVGTYPITGAAITGLTCAEVTDGSVYDRDATYTGVACRITDAALLLAAVTDMEEAYNNASVLPACINNTGGGNIGNMTLVHGVYYWVGAVTIPTNLTISGTATDTWVFQVNGALGLAANTHIILTGGAKASNIYWVVSGATSLGANSVFTGNILDKTAITFGAGATLNGRAFAQTAVTLSSNTLTKP